MGSFFRYEGCDNKFKRGMGSFFPALTCGVFQGCGVPILSTGERGAVTSRRHENVVKLSYRRGLCHFVHVLWMTSKPL